MIPTYSGVAYVVTTAMSVSDRRSLLITWDMSGSLWPTTVARFGPFVRKSYSGWR